MVNSSENDIQMKITSYLGRPESFGGSVGIASSNMPVLVPSKVLKSGRSSLLPPDSRPRRWMSRKGPRRRPKKGAKAAKRGMKLVEAEGGGRMPP